jgi:uncharacterized protein (TIGR02231 family)
MRCPVALATALLAAPAFAGEMPPPVIRATVYPDGAIVVRAVDAECRSGAATADFLGLPPVLDPNSVRAAATTPDASVMGLSLTDRLRERPYGDELARLDAEIKDVQRQIDDLERDSQRALVSQQRAASLRERMAPFVAREAVVEVKPNVAAWTAGLAATRKAIEDARATAHDDGIRIRKLTEKRDDLQRHRNELSGAAPEHAWDARVALSCSGRTHVELSYVVVEAAGWTPLYEAREDPAAGNVSLAMLAQVHQATGEPWSDVGITLSTAHAVRDSRPPTLQRLYLGAMEHKEEQKVLVRRDEAAQHLSRPTDKNAEPTGPALPEDQGLSVQLAIQGTSDVPGDGSMIRLPVETHTLAAHFSLLSVPKVLPAVVHRAVFRNETGHPLLPGPVDLFGRSGFLGTSHLDQIAEHDDVKLAFGLDEAVKVKRVVLREQSSQTGLFGSSRRLDYAYRVELNAAGSTPVKVEVQEHIPVSELDDVKVTVGKETSEGAQVSAVDGLLTWLVPLQPGEKKNIELHFSIDITSSYESGGL